MGIQKQAIAMPESTNMRDAVMNERVLSAVSLANSVCRGLCGGLTPIFLEEIGICAWKEVAHRTSHWKAWLQADL